MSLIQQKCLTVAYYLCHLLQHFGAPDMLSIHHCEKVSLESSHLLQSGCLLHINTTTILESLLRIILRTLSSLPCVLSFVQSSIISSIHIYSLWVWFVRHCSRCWLYARGWKGRQIYCFHWPYTMVIIQREFPSKKYSPLLHGCLISSTKKN